MYLVNAKTVITQAMRKAFAENSPEPDFAAIPVSIEYPIDRQNYPSIWVDFDPTGDLSITGIGQRERLIEADSLSSSLYRWRFSGTSTFTMVAMTSLERDRLYDAVIRVLAFGDAGSNLSPFRSFIQNNDLIAMNMNFDKIGQRGFATAQGTPWGTDEVIYEATLTMDSVGEFVVSNDAAIVPLSQVNVIEWVETEADPAPNGNWLG